MNVNGICQHAIQPIEAALMAGNEVATDFSTTLDKCTHEFQCGRFTVVFPLNLYAHYGEMLFNYFQKTLSERIHAPVHLSSVVDSNGSRSHIHMGQLGGPEYGLDVQPVISSQTATSDLVAAGPNTVLASKKKVPRPMNSWMCFRDEMHKQLKQEHPNISVQEISKRCSQIWRAYGDKEKKFWKGVSISAAEEHKRMYPDYKYQPRKAGEKKKRQSRKTKPAAATAAAAQSVTTPFAIVADIIAATSSDVDHGFINSPTPPVDPLDIFATEQQEQAVRDQLYATESLRQDRLQAEFDFDFDFNLDFPTDLFAENAFGFRTDASTK